MKQTYIFDVDGTLTVPRQPIEPLFAKFFLEFARHRSVVLVPGSDLGKLPVSYTHLTLPTTCNLCRSRWAGDR